MGLVFNPFTGNFDFVGVSTPGPTGPTGPTGATGPTGPTGPAFSRRVVTATDATSITPNTDNADITYQLNTQASGATLTINADTGSPINGQSWALKIKATNTQTFSWNSGTKGYAGGVIALPATTSSGALIDYFTFIYDTVNSRWQFTGQALGF